MQDSELSMFIEEMEEIGDVWELEDVKRVYGDVSLEEAIADRKKSVGMFLDIIANTII